eukprot:330285-Rhodomonas_salina.12
MVSVCVVAVRAITRAVAQRRNHKRAPVSCGADWTERIVFSSGICGCEAGACLGQASWFAATPGTSVLRSVSTNAGLVPALDLLAPALYRRVSTNIGTPDTSVVPRWQNQQWYQCACPGPHTH